MKKIGGGKVDFSFTKGKAFAFYEGKKPPFFFSPSFFFFWSGIRVSCSWSVRFFCIVVLFYSYLKDVLYPERSVVIFSRFSFFFSFHLPNYPMSVGVNLSNI